MFSRNIKPNAIVKNFIHIIVDKKIIDEMKESGITDKTTTSEEEPKPKVPLSGRNTITSSSGKTGWDRPRTGSARAASKAARQEEKYTWFDATDSSLERIRFNREFLDEALELVALELNTDDRSSISFGLNPNSKGSSFSKKDHLVSQSRL